MRVRIKDTALNFGRRAYPSDIHQTDHIRTTPVPARPRPRQLHLPAAVPANRARNTPQWPSGSAAAERTVCGPSVDPVIQAGRRQREQRWQRCGCPIRLMCRRCAAEIAWERRDAAGSIIRVSVGWLFPHRMRALSLPSTLIPTVQLPVIHIVAQLSNQQSPNVCVRP